MVPTELLASHQISHPMSLPFACRDAASNEHLHSKAVDSMLGVAESALRQSLFRLDVIGSTRSQVPEHSRFHNSHKFKRLLGSASWQPACYLRDRVRNDADTTTRRRCHELDRPRCANRKCRRIGRKT